MSQTHFHCMKGFLLELALKQRQKVLGNGLFSDTVYRPSSKATFCSDWSVFSQYLPCKSFLVYLWEFFEQPQGDPVVWRTFFRIQIYIVPSLCSPQMFSQTHAKDDGNDGEHCYDTKTKPQSILGRNDTSWFINTNYKCI